MLGRALFFRRIHAFRQTGLGPAARDPPVQNIVKAQPGKHGEGQGLIHAVITQGWDEKTENIGSQADTQIKKMKKVVVAWAKRERDTSESDTACPTDWKLPKPMPSTRPESSSIQLLCARASRIRESAVNSRIG